MASTRNGCHGGPMWPLGCLSVFIRTMGAATKPACAQNMMTGKISFVASDHSGNRSRRLSLPVVWLFFFGLTALSGVVLVGFGVYQILHLRQSMGVNGQMSSTIAVQRDEIAQQRLQIQSFAHEIDDLKDQLVNLGQFEEKIRLIANIEPQRADEQPFGVGGPAFEDLDPRMELTQRHEGLIREMHRQVNDLGVTATRQADRFSSLMEKLEGQRNLLASTPAIGPASGWMTSRFGYRKSPFTNRKEFHKGVDIANRKGTAILATANGIVSFAGKKGTMGNVVVIDHGHGMITRYAHLSESLKKPGERVKRGDIIAQMGNSGRSTGPHVHYEVHLNGVPVDPAKYILN